MRKYLILLGCLTGCGASSTTSTSIPITGTYSGTATLYNDACSGNCHAAASFNTVISGTSGSYIATAPNGAQIPVTQQAPGSCSWSIAESNVPSDNCTLDIVDSVDLVLTTSGATGTFISNTTGTCSDGSSGTCDCDYKISATRS